MATFRGKVITQPFGVRNSVYRMGYHAGTDFAYELNERQPALASGIARFQKDTGSGYGNTGTITLSNGDVLFYAHLKANGILVKSGSKVTEGQAVFITGDTGYIRGVHAHIEYRLKGDQNRPVDLTKKLEDYTMLTATQVKNIFKSDLRRNPDAAEVKKWTGKPELALRKGVINTLKKREDNHKKTITDIRKQLEAAQKKPAEVVVKEVEKIVEKVVEVDATPSILRRIAEFLGIKGE